MCLMCTDLMCHVFPDFMLIFAEVGNVCITEVEDKFLYLSYCTVSYGIVRYHIVSYHTVSYCIVL